MATSAVTPRKGRPTPSRPRKATTEQPQDTSFSWTSPETGISIEIDSLSTVQPTMESIEYLVEALDDAENPFKSFRAQLKFVQSMLPEAEYAKVRKLRMQEFADFISAWGKWSGISLGE